MNPEDKPESSNPQHPHQPSDLVSSSPTPVVQPSTEHTTPPTTPSLAINTQSPKKKPKLRNYILLLVVLVAFGVVIWGAFKIIDKNKPVSSASTTKHDIADLRVASTEPLPTTFFPAASNEAYTFEVNAQIFEGLTKFVNLTQVAPDLATSWTNPNNSTWVFQLKQGVKFHDGNTLTSSQVVASLTQAKNAPIGSVVPYTIKTATAEGPYTVQITTSQPDPLLDRELTQFWIWDTSDTATPNNSTNGTGPYVLKPGTQVTASSVHLIAYNNYQGGTPSVQQLDFYNYGSAQQLVDGLKQNKIDVADFTNETGSAALAKNAGFSLLNVVDPLVYYIIPNTLKQGSPLQNLKVRQAIYMTLNPTLLASAHNGDVGAPATQLVPPSIPGFDSSIKRPAINITEAKSLLAQAGYPNGFTVGFTYYSPPQDGVALELQKELGAIGIKLNLDPQTDADAFFAKIGNGTVDMFVEGDASQILDTSDVAAYMVIDTPEYSNAKVDTLFKQAQQTFDAKSRLKLLQQLNDTVMSDLALFPIDTPNNLDMAYRPGIVLQEQYLGGISGIYYSQVYSSK